MCRNDDAVCFLASKFTVPCFFPFSKPVLLFDFSVWEKFFFAQKRARRGGLQIW